MVFAFPPQGIISSEQGNRTKAGEGGRCVFPSFFVPSSILLACSPVSPSFLRPRLQKTAFYLSLKKGKRGRPPSVQDRHLFPFGKKPGKANVEYTILRPLFVFVFFRFEKHFLFSREAVFFVPSAKCVSLPSLKKRKRKEGNCHAVGIRRQEGGAAILLALSSGRTFPPFFPKKERKEKTEHRNPSSRRKAFPASRREKEKKEKSERKESSCLSGRTLLPALGEKAKRKGGTPFFGTVLPSCKKGNASRCGIRKRRFLSPLQFGITPLSEKRKRKNIIRTTGRRKRRKEKYRPFLAVPPFSYVLSSALF